MPVILLATHNGQGFLEPLLESICNQTLRSWTLLASDDASDDRTRSILQRWSARDTRIRILPAGPSRLGVLTNFGRLLECARAEGHREIALADQDDVWLRDKLEQQVYRLRYEQLNLPPRTPVLVHTDLAVVDRRLHVLHPSLRNFAALEPHRRCSLKSLLMHNCVTGCSTMFNQSLLDLALPLPATAVMHDWWLALCAAGSGRIAYIPSPTVLYRQHEHNVLGAQGAVVRSALARVLGGRRQWRHDMTHFFRSVEQARALRDRIRSTTVRVDPQSVRLLESYCRIFDEPRSALTRLSALVRMGLPDVHPLRRALSYCRVLLLNHHAGSRA
ncbi:MAG: glycosyltransferase family 2 protein [Planctomycetaceae bacterium]